MTNTPVKSNRAQDVVADTETVAQILERELHPLIHDWLLLVQEQEVLMAIPLTDADRTGYAATIADEVDAQLKLQMLRYITASAVGTRPLSVLINWSALEISFPAFEVPLTPSCNLKHQHVCDRCGGRSDMGEATNVCATDWVPTGRRPVDH
jgi:hypothetical protein